MANSTTKGQVARMRAGFMTLALCVALSACGTAPNEPSSTGAIDTGTYPNLNIKPGVANDQLTSEQTAAKSAELRAAQRANSGQASPPPNDVILLRKIGQSHAKEALEEIEGQ